MLTIFVVTLLATSAWAFPGKPRIVGGDEADPHSHPWQATLQNRGSHSCGASIVSNNWLVTAAHCVIDAGQRDLSIAIAAHDLDVVEAGTTYSIEEIIMHPGYQPNSAGLPNDIALLKTQTRMTLNSKAKFILLPELGKEFYGNNNCYITGWGLTQGTQDNSVLQELKVEVKSQGDCINAWGPSYINYKHICVENGDTGACYGDSGGPLACYDNGKWYLAGVTSWGVSGCQTRGYPSVYSRVSEFEEWLVEMMGPN